MCLSPAVSIHRPSLSKSTQVMSSHECTPSKWPTTSPDRAEKSETEALCATATTSASAESATSLRWSAATKEPICSCSGSCPRSNSTSDRKRRQVPSLPRVATREESAEKSNEKTPEEWPVSSKARWRRSNSPVRLN